MEGRGGTEGEAGEPAAAAGPRIARRRQSLQLALGWGKVGIEEGKHGRLLARLTIPPRPSCLVTSVAAWLCLGSWANGLVTLYITLYNTCSICFCTKLFGSPRLKREMAGNELTHTLKD